MEKFLFGIKEVVANLILEKLILQTHHSKVL